MEMIVDRSAKGTRSMLNKDKVTKARRASRTLSGEDSTKVANVAMVTCEQGRLHMYTWLI